MFPTLLYESMCLCKYMSIHKYKCKYSSPPNHRWTVLVFVVPVKFIQIMLVSKGDKRTFVLHSSIKLPLYPKDVSPFIICIIFPIMQVCISKMTLQDILNRLSSPKPDSQGLRWVDSVEQCYIHRFSSLSLVKPLVNSIHIMSVTRKPLRRT